MHATPGDSSAHENTRRKEAFDGFYGILSDGGNDRRARYSGVAILIRILNLKLWGGVVPFRGPHHLRGHRVGACLGAWCSRNTLQHYA